MKKTLINLKRYKNNLRNMKILKLNSLKKQFFSSKLTLKPETDAFQKKVKNNVLKIQNYYKKCKVIGL